MTDRISEQLEKVLALADSTHEGEALGALRMARRLMEREGLTFADLASAARRQQFSMTRSLFLGSNAQWEAKVDQLLDELNAHVEQNQNLSSQIAHWRQRAFDLEQMLRLNRSETERWKDMARETAERLWDLGQIARAEAALQDTVSDEDLPDAQDKLKAVG